MVQISILTYSERNEILLSMGFNSYEEYQGSRLWAEIRLLVLKRDRFSCALCEGPANQAHHSKYTVENLAGLALTHIHAVCQGCHQTIEFDGENKLTTRQAFNKFYGLLRSGEMKRLRPPIGIKADNRKRGYITGMAYKRFHESRKRK